MRARQLVQKSRAFRHDLRNNSTRAQCLSLLLEKHWLVQIAQKRKARASTVAQCDRSSVEGPLGTWGAVDNPVQGGPFSKACDMECGCFGDGSAVGLTEEKLRRPPGAPLCDLHRQFDTIARAAHVHAHSLLTRSPHVVTSSLLHAQPAHPQQPERPQQPARPQHLVRRCHADRRWSWTAPPSAPTSGCHAPRKPP